MGRILVELSATSASSTGSGGDPDEPLSLRGVIQRIHGFRLRNLFGSHHRTLKRRYHHIDRDFRRYYAEGRITTISSKKKTPNDAKYHLVYRKSLAIRKESTVMNLMRSSFCSIRWATQPSGHTLRNTPCSNGPGLQEAAYDIRRGQVQDYEGHGRCHGVRRCIPH